MRPLGIGRTAKRGSGIGHPFPKPHNQTAFTLIELLVVLIIVAIVMAIAVMAFGDFGKSRKQHLAALQLEQTMIAAKTQAILQPAVLGLTFTSKGYHYYRYWLDPKTQQPMWISLHDDVLSQPYAFDTASKIQVNNIKNTKQNSNVKGVQPLIYFLPNGTVTKFSVTIQFPNKQAYIIDSDGAGGITLEEK